MLGCVTAVRLREWRAVKPVAAPSGVAVSTRLRTTRGDEHVLDLVAEHLGRLRRADLTRVCHPVRLDPSPDGASKRQAHRDRLNTRKKALTAQSSARRANAIIAANDTQYRSARDAQHRHLLGLKAAIATISTPQTRPPGRSAVLRWPWTGHASTHRALRRLRPDFVDRSRARDPAKERRGAHPNHRRHGGRPHPARQQVQLLRRAAGRLVVVDPSRVAAQIVSGIGFLGAGIIIFRRGSVHGLTTAAAVWESAAIGMAAGAGLLVLAVTVTAMHFVIIVGFMPLAKRLSARLAGSVTVHITYEEGRGVMSRLLQACDRRQWQLTDLAADSAGEHIGVGSSGVMLTLSGRGILTAPTVLAGIEGVTAIRQFDDEPD
jgi:hypothetical protein